MGLQTLYLNTEFGDKMEKWALAGRLVSNTFGADIGYEWAGNKLYVLSSSIKSDCLSIIYYLLSINDLNVTLPLPKPFSLSFTIYAPISYILYISNLAYLKQIEITII